MTAARIVTRIARRAIAPAAIAIGLLGVPGAGAAELAEWDQERVAAIAKRLAKTSSALYDSFYAAGDPSAASGHSTSWYRLKQNLRRLRAEARHLASQLEGGAGRAETLSVYQTLMRLVRDSQEEARRVFAEGPTLDRAAEVGNELFQIAPYYDPKAASNPELEELEEPEP